MNRLLLPVLVVIIATTAILLVSGRTSASLVPLTRGHDPADYGSGPVTPITPHVQDFAQLPGHQPQDYRDTTTPTEDPLVTRGRYLTNQASLCIDCHTPHGPQGPLMDQHLHGSPIPFKPTIDMPWADVAPRIAGLLVFNENHVRTLLTTGKRPDGSSPRPPMPPYHLNREDADAIIAYLKTLR
jgi:mono/diheme cytochrome c family protein